MAARDSDFTVAEMRAWDEFNLGAGCNWALVNSGLASSPYQNEVLSLRSSGGGLGQTMDVGIPMTQAEYSTFDANRP